MLAFFLLILNLGDVSGKEQFPFVNGIAVQSGMPLLQIKPFMVVGEYGHLLGGCWDSLWGQHAV